MSYRLTDFKGAIWTASWFEDFGGTYNCQQPNANGINGIIRLSLAGGPKDPYQGKRRIKTKQWVDANRSKLKKRSFK